MPRGSGCRLLGDLEMHRRSGCRFPGDPDMPRGLCVVSHRILRCLGDLGVIFQGS